MFKKYIDPSSLLDILCYKTFSKHNDFVMKRKAKKFFFWGGCLIKQEFIILREKNPNSIFHIRDGFQMQTWSGCDLQTGTRERNPS